jgi:hypothetical protein
MASAFMDFRAGRDNEGAWVAALQMASTANDQRLIREALVIIGKHFKVLRET